MPRLLAITTEHMGGMGIQIAATALEHGLTLDTKNVRHFQMIPALTVARPY